MDYENYHYQDSILWKATLGLVTGNTDTDKLIDKLRVSYEDTRDKVKILAGSIRHDMQNYPDHGITHCDALWDMADIVLLGEDRKNSHELKGKAANRLASKLARDYQLNPAEGYVLGIAFLIHDLGMSISTYPGGEAGLHQCSIWRDTVATKFQEENGRPIQAEDWGKLDANIVKDANESALRRLHAEQATKLLSMEWEDKEKSERLIENDKLLRWFGELIGKIACSHWWSLEKVERQFKHESLGTPYSGWQIDPLKLACIMRIADAMHVDCDRAPGFLMKLQKPNMSSRLHWIFQQKLSSPFVENNMLVYDAHDPFLPNDDEMNAWWLCYDTMRMIDRELVTVNNLLREHDISELKANGVRGISSTDDLANYIKVKDWVPVDTSIRVSDVPQLVSRLGGEQLYGDDPFVPMRELIQNAADAVRAMKLMRGASSRYKGEITIAYQEAEDHTMIEVIDNGVGMSQNVLLGPFLDFGHSFWHSELMYEELPQLASKGFTSTGQYGIGFYSVFMWSNEVTVITRRYNAAEADTLVLEFKDGLGSRPICRKAEDNERLETGGTKVRVRAGKDILERIIGTHGDIETEITMRYPCSDCDLYIQKNGEKRKQIEEADDWKTIPSSELISRLAGERIDKVLTKYGSYDALLENMELLEEDGVVYGRAVLFNDSFPSIRALFVGMRGYITLGGFVSRNVDGITGVLVGKSTNAARNSAVPIVPPDVVRDFVTNQAQQPYLINLSKDDQLRFSEVILDCGVRPPDNLVFTRGGAGYLSYMDIVNLVQQNSDEKAEFIVCLNYEFEYKSELKYNSNVITYSIGHHSRTSDALGSFYFPNAAQQPDIRLQFTMIVNAILEGWGISKEDVEKHIMHNKPNSPPLRAVVGKRDGQDDEEGVTMIIRRTPITAQPEPTNPALPPFHTEAESSVDRTV